MAAFLFQIEWDSAKARSNLTKHHVSFEEAAQIFHDPLALTIPDEEHSVGESRWITLGKDALGHYCLVVHTYQPVDESAARVRIISARRPGRAEIRAYEEQQ
ncbi:MAG: BrnT family toxin [Acidobacteria bacterium]|nr:BrnT family toxin [Acidobacteriota bacterium]